MTISQQTQSLVNQLDEFSGHRIQNKDELSYLIEIAKLKSQQQLLNDIAFFSKFVWKVYGIMRRSGPDSEGYEKLQTEFKENFEKVSTLIKTLIEEESEELKQQFINKFFQMDQQTLENFLGLIYDLTWLKNWGIEHKTAM